MAGKIGILGSGAGILALGVGSAAAGIAAFYALKEAYAFGSKIAEDVLGKDATDIVAKTWQKTTLLGWILSRRE